MAYPQLAQWEKGKDFSPERKGGWIGIPPKFILSALRENRHTLKGLEAHAHRD